MNGQAGKGSRYRPMTAEQKRIFDENWNSVFGDKNSKEKIVKNETERKSIK